MADSICSSRAGELLKLVEDEEMIKILECPICLEIPLPPIKMCINGHSICSDCHSRLTRCGICPGAFYNIRNLAMESLINASMFHCKFRVDGCKDHLRGENFKHHLDICNYRPIVCYETKGTACDGSMIFFNDYLNHVKSQHMIKGNDRKDSSISMFQHTYNLDKKKNNIWPLYYKCFKDHVFLLNTRIKDSMMHWWIVVVGDENIAANYSARLTLYRHDAVTRIEYYTPVFPIRHKFEEVEPYICSMLPSKALLQFCTLEEETGRMKYTWFLDVNIEEIGDDEE